MTLEVLDTKGDARLVRHGGCLMLEGLGVECSVDRDGDLAIEVETEYGIDYYYLPARLVLRLLRESGVTE